MPNKTLFQIFLLPALVALASLSGLILALLYDDAREVLANAAIAAPMIVAVIFYCRSFVVKR